MTQTKITRRQAIADALAAAATGLLLTSCGGSAAASAASGSTLDGTLIDPLGVGVLRRGPGEALLARTDLGPQAPHEK